MSNVGIVFMVLICSIVWGGFLSLLGWMILSERRKSRTRESAGA